jgi:hypothetical protein
MAKLNEPIHFIVIPNGYNFPIRVIADWETDKSFGVRGETFDAVRYKKSTGQMYNKSNCTWVKFDNKADCSKAYESLKVFSEKIDSLRKDIKEETTAMIEYLKTLSNQK